MKPEARPGPWTGHPAAPAVIASFSYPVVVRAGNPASHTACGGGRLMIDAHEHVALGGVLHRGGGVFRKEEPLLDAPLHEALDGFDVATVGTVELLQRGSRIARRLGRLLSHREGGEHAVELAELGGGQRGAPPGPAG